METLAKTDYQDVYRITDGVLLVINKFEYDDKYPTNIWADRKYAKKYSEGVQDQLKIITKDYPYQWNTNKINLIPKGTVTYMSNAVKLVTEDKWTYEIKTTGSAFSGNKEEIIPLLANIHLLILGIDK